MNLLIPSKIEFIRRDKIMMDKELIKALKPIEEEFDADLFTFDEALEFYESEW